MRPMRRVAMALGAVLVAGCSAAMGGGAGRVPVELIGTWNGVGSQTDQAGEWTIEAIIVGGPVEQVGTISYPSLECGGVLLFRGVRNGVLEVMEDITYGQCVDEGIITFTPTAGGTARFDWRKEGYDATARGTLTRVR